MDYFICFPAEIRQEIYRLLFTDLVIYLTVRYGAHHPIRWSGSPPPNVKFHHPSDSGWAIVFASKAIYADATFTLYSHATWRYLTENISGATKCKSFSFDLTRARILELAPEVELQEFLHYEAEYPDLEEVRLNLLGLFVRNPPQTQEHSQLVETVENHPYKIWGTMSRREALLNPTTALWKHTVPSSTRRFKVLCTIYFHYAPYRTLESGEILRIPNSQELCNWASKWIYDIDKRTIFRSKPVLKFIWNGHKYGPLAEQETDGNHLKTEVVEKNGRIRIIPAFAEETCYLVRKTYGRRLGGGRV